jgi:hypothetical protein
LRELALLCESSDHESVVLLYRLPNSLPGEKLRALLACARKLRAQLRVVDEAAHRSGEGICIPRLHQ